MDCQAARLLLWFKRPNGKEMLPEDEAALALHLSTCDTCGRFARLHGEEHRLLGTAIRAVSVPPKLLDAILVRLSSAARPRRRWPWVVGGVASAALLCGFGLWLWLASSVPPASLREMEWFGKNRFSLPATYPPLKKQAWLEQYFYSQRVYFRLPELLKNQWDFTHLTAAYPAELSHDRVAVLEFKKPGGHAVVFVVPTARLDSSEMEQYLSFGEYTRLLHQPGEEFSALAVLKEGSLEQFLLPRQ